MNLRAFPAAVVVALAAMAGDAGLVRAQDDGVTALLRRLEQVTLAADFRAYSALHSPLADPARAREFAGTELRPGLTNVVIQERNRERLRGALPGDGFRVTVDAFQQSGDIARVSTWQLDLKRLGVEGTDTEWLIADEEAMSSVENLYRLSLNPARQYAPRNFKITSDDLELTLVEGAIFVAETTQGVAALVFVGRGEMSFRPAPKTERGQVRIFAGAETLATRFDALYLRLHPSEFAALMSGGQLMDTPVDAREFRRADDVFQAESPKTFALDLRDLSREPWSLLPSVGDVLAEIRTRRFASLTYARSASEYEDVNLFDRPRGKNIALYASQRSLAARESANDEGESSIDVIDYNIAVTATPGRQWIEGVTTISMRVRANAINSITLRLAAPLVVRSIVSREFGYMFGLRIRNQNSLVINLPVVMPRDSRISLTVTYGGRLDPVAPDSETLQQYPWPADFAGLTGEPYTLYSTGVYWYPQPGGSDFATATLNLTIPSGVALVASGNLQAGSPQLVTDEDSGQAQKLYVYKAPQPLRYFAFVVSRFVKGEQRSVAFAGPASATTSPGLKYQNLDLSVDANPRQVVSGPAIADRAEDIATFYKSIVDDLPYPSLTLVLTEHDLPGGHSPGYFAMLHQPLVNSSPYSWRNDPAAFPGFPEFFLAHEVAHQWWGQAVGWRNYHEQWLSEGFAQYFAALYAQRLRGEPAFAPVMRQMRKWAIEMSAEGPIALGYRLGHIRGNSKVFRAIVYNKSAAVLHMLRRLVGDDVFFRGVRRFYHASRFQRVGTGELRSAMEAESGRSLERFFDRWIYGDELPKVRFTYAVDGNDVVLRAEQLDEVFDLPLTITLQYADKKTVDVIFPVTERIADLRVPLTGTLRTAFVSKDDGTLAEIVKN